MGHEHRVDYEPAESSTGLFGGNSNWRGPIWFPVNYLLIESLQKFHYFLGDSIRWSIRRDPERNSHSGKWRRDVAPADTSFCAMPKAGGRCSGERKVSTEIRSGETLMFYEYFHGDNGAGIGARHQTGWTDSWRS